MPRVEPSARRRGAQVALLVAVVALPLALWGLLPLASRGASPERAQRLESRIEEKQQAIARRRGRERVLTTDISAWSRRIRRLQDDIVVLQGRQVRLQVDLDASRSELSRLQDRLRAERVRLARLRARLAEARTALEGRLVALYKADKPDVVTVILESDGFADLLERTEFMQRVSDQDARIIELVRAARTDAVRTARRLDRLEDRQRAVATAIEARRDEVAAVRSQLVDRRQGYQSARARKGELLASTRERRQHDEVDLAVLRREQAQVQAALRRAAAASAGSGSGSGASAPAGPVRAGSGGLIWPVNGPVISPFGQRWGRLHAGVDIPAPSGTPIRAAAAGRVVLMGWTGGYGNYTCVQHSGSLSTCYAHQSAYRTSRGASVSQGQVIGAVGTTGNSTGNHLHFETRINGSPVDPMGYL